MGRLLTDEEVKTLQILSGKEFLIRYLVDTFADENRDVIKDYPYTLEECMYFFFNEYGYTAGNKVVEINQLKDFHLKIKKEMENIIEK